MKQLIFRYISTVALSLLVFVAAQAFLGGIPCCSFGAYWGFPFSLRQDGIIGRFHARILWLGLVADLAIAFGVSIVARQIWFYAVTTRIGQMNKNRKMVGIFATGGLAVPIGLLLYVAIFVEPIRKWRPTLFLGGVGPKLEIIFPGMHGVFGGYDAPPPSWWYIGSRWIEASIQNIIIYALIGMAIAAVLKLTRGTATATKSD